MPEGIIKVNSRVWFRECPTCEWRIGRVRSYSGDWYTVSPGTMQQEEINVHRRAIRRYTTQRPES